MRARGFSRQPRRDHLAERFPFLRLRRRKNLHTSKHATPRLQVICPPAAVNMRHTRHECAPKPTTFVANPRWAEGAMSSASASANITRVSFVASHAVSEWRIDACTRSAARRSRRRRPGARRRSCVFDGGGAAAAAVRGRFAACAATSATSSGEEKQRLAPIQQGLGRPASKVGALIPSARPTPGGSFPDERRAVFEARSRHIAIGAQYLPAVARRLHSRDLGEPFDFLTCSSSATWTPARSTTCWAACARRKSGNRDSRGRSPGARATP